MKNSLLTVIKEARAWWFSSDKPKLILHSLDNTVVVLLSDCLVHAFLGTCRQTTQHWNKCLLRENTACMVERTQRAWSREHSMQGRWKVWGLWHFDKFQTADLQDTVWKKRSIFRKPTEHVRHLNDIELDYNALNGRSFPDCTVQVVKAGLFKSRFRKKKLN